MNGRERVGATAACAALLAALTVAAPTPASAQAPSGGTGIGSGITFQYIGFDNPATARFDNVSLLTVPLAGRASLGERVTLEVGGHWARGHLERADGSSTTIAGLTDATLSASLELGDGAATITGIARVPTGETGYTLRELDVVGVVASDLFPFRISSWGTGGGFGVRAATTRPLGSADATLSVGYFRSGQFDPLEEQLVDYRPGDRLSARAALTFPLGQAGQLGLQGGFRSFADDELQGQDVFESGNRYDALATWSFPVGSDAGFLYGGYQRRSEGRRLQLQEPTAGQDLLLAGAGLRMQVAGIRLRPSVDGRLVEREDGRSEGWGLRAGARAELPVGEATVLPLVRGHVGNVSVDPRPGVDSAFLGFEVGATVRLGG